MRDVLLVENQRKSGAFYPKKQIPNARLSMEDLALNLIQKINKKVDHGQKNFAEKVLEVCALIHTCTYLTTVIHAAHHLWNPITPLSSLVL
jgi:hypothetical protein